MFEAGGEAAQAAADSELALTQVRLMRPGIAAAGTFGSSGA